MKLRKVWVGILALGTTFVITAFVIPVEYLIPGDKGDIVYAQRCTRLMLRRYEITRNPSELRAWLPKLDGAPGQEAGAIFTGWGIDHPADFVAILNGLDGHDRHNAVQLVSYAIEDRRIAADDFNAAFQQINEPIITEIRAEIRSETP